MLDRLAEGHANMAEMALSQRLHAMEPTAGVERIGHQHCIVYGGDLDAVSLQHERIVFQVLADLQD